MEEVAEDITVVQPSQTDPPANNGAAEVEEESKDKQLLMQMYRSGRWEPDETTKLVELWRNHVFASLKKYKTFRIDKDVWRGIAAELAKANVPRPPEQCQIRIKNLLQQCRFAKQAGAQLGKSKTENETGSSTIPGYIEMINEVLQYKDRPSDGLVDTTGSPLTPSASTALKRKSYSNRFASVTPHKRTRESGDDGLSDSESLDVGTTNPDGESNSTGNEGDLSTEPGSSGRLSSTLSSATPIANGVTKRETYRRLSERSAIERAAVRSVAEIDALKDVIRLQDKQLEKFHELETKRLLYEQERLAVDKSLVAAIVDAASTISKAFTLTKQNTSVKEEVQESATTTTTI